MINRHSVNHLLEILRYAGIFAGFWSAFQYGNNPVAQLNILAPWAILSLAGLTGLESIFFGKSGAETIGYKSGSEYQVQSGMNNLALAVSALLSTLFGWGVYANVALLVVLMIFFFLSGINHFWMFLKGGNRGLKNLSRPFASTLLVACILPMVIRALMYGK
jgi:hypothetical protein